MSQISVKGSPRDLNARDSFGLRKHRAYPLRADIKSGTPTQIDFCPLPSSCANPTMGAAGAEVEITGIGYSGCDAEDLLQFFASL